VKLPDKAGPAPGLPWVLKFGLPALFLFFVVFIIVAAVNDAPSGLKTTRTKFAVIESALKLYRARHGVYPTTAAGWKELVSDQLLDEIPKDGWGSDLLFESDGIRFEIISLGADGEPGGTGVNADLRFSGK
jgi:general secretion pathway protein G